MRKHIPYDPDAFLHWMQVPVRFRDLDPLNHVNNAIFNTYFEESRISYLRSIPPLLDDFGKDRSSVLVHLNLNYVSTVSYPCILTIGARIESTGNTSVSLMQACYDESTKELKAFCDSVLVWFDLTKQKPARLPHIPSSFIYQQSD